MSQTMVSPKSGGTATVLPTDENGDPVDPATMSRADLIKTYKKVNELHHTEPSGERRKRMAAYITEMLAVAIDRGIRDELPTDDDLDV